jgi:predicted dehydrogenase
MRLAVLASRQRAPENAFPEGAEIVADPSAAARHHDVDLVVIATPNDSHAPLAEAALRAGKHVVVDKPFTITLAEGCALADTAAAEGRVLSVFQNRRWDSDFLGVRRELAAGRIGEPAEVRSEFSRWRPQVRDRWRERAGPGSGVWYDLGPHLIDQVLVLFGPPETVLADLRVQRRGGAAIDWFHAVLGYGSMRVLLTSSMLAADAPSRWLLRGSSGSILKRCGDRQEDQLVRTERPGSPGWGSDADPLVFMPGESKERISLAAPPGDYLAYYAGIRDAIEGKGAVPVTPAEATTAMRILEAGLESARNGCVVRPAYGDAERAAWSAPGTR